MFAATRRTRRVLHVVSFAVTACAAFWICSLGTTSLITTSGVIVAAMIHGAISQRVRFFPSEQSRQIPLAGRVFLMLGAGLGWMAVFVLSQLAYDLATSQTGPLTARGLIAIGLFLFGTSLGAALMLMLAGPVISRK